MFSEPKPSSTYLCARGRCKHLRMTIASRWGLAERSMSRHEWQQDGPEGRNNIRVLIVVVARRARALYRTFALNASRKTGSRV